METQEKKIKIKFDGQLHQIDAQTFIGSLVNFSEVVKQVNVEFNPDSRVEIKITATGQGSFITDLLLIGQTSAHLFSSDNMTYMADLVVITTGLYGFRRWLGSKKVDETKEKPENKVEVKDNDGNVTIIRGDVYKIYNNNQEANDAISNNFASLEEDPSVTGFEISDESGSLFKAGREDFSALSIKSEFESADLKRSVVAANLIINKLVFDGRDRKWEFYYGGNQISATIEDEDFFEAINQGERFAKGDQLNVDLEISQVFEPSLKTFVNHSYKVVKVKEHIPRDQKSQTDLFSIE